MAYKFRASEIEEMKREIMIHCESEIKQGKAGTAWRLGLVLQTLSDCSSNKKKRAKCERKYALYLKLTEQDLPKW